MGFPTKWLREHFLVTPIRNNEIKLNSPNGPVSIVIHHAFEKIREGIVMSVPRYPKYDAMRYMRMYKNEADVPKLTFKTVPCEVEEGDIIGFSAHMVADGEEQNRIHFINVPEELYEVNFSQVYYHRKPDSDKIHLTPGWSIVEVDKKTQEEYLGILLLNMEQNKTPFSGKVRYVSEGPDGTEETLGVKVGDRIAFTKKMNVAIEINGEALFLISHSQMLAKYAESDE